MTISSRELALTLGVPSKAVGTLVKEGRLPQGSIRGQHSVGLLLAFLWGRLSAAGADGRESLAQWRANRAALSGLDLEERRGELISYEAARRVLYRQIAEAQMLLRNLPESLAAGLPSDIQAHFVETAEREVHRVIRALAEAESPLPALDVGAPFTKELTAMCDRYLKVGGSDDKTIKDRPQILEPGPDAESDSGRD